MENKNLNALEYSEILIFNSLVYIIPVLRQQSRTEMKVADDKNKSISYN